MNSISKTIKRSLAFALSFVMVVSVLTTVPATTTEAAAKKIVKSVAVSKSKTTITAGKSTTLKAKVTATKKVAASDLKVTVKSSKKSIATVKITKNPAKKAKSGYTYFKVTGKKAGKATITVTAKNKSTKGKTVKKSIAVTVKAKPTTQATTAAPTTEAPFISLKDIVVESSNGLSIPEKGGQTTLSAKSATEGCDIAKVTFKSLNEQIATVDELTGVVTGVNVGTVTIVVTAIDAKGNSVDKNVSVTIIAKSNAKVTLDKESTTIFVGKTELLKATVTDNDKNEEVVWSSDNEAVATVDKTGLVTAVSKGNANISVKVGSTAVASCAVTVTDEAPGIAEFKATHANTLQVTLTAAIAKEDREKVVTSLKLGQSEPTVEKKWSEDGKSIEFVKNSDFVVGTYTVSLDSQDLTFDPANNTKTFELKEGATVTSISIDTKAVMKEKAASIAYTVKDQYGDPIKEIAAGDYAYSLTCTNTKVKFVSGAGTLSSKDLKVNLKESGTGNDLEDASALIADTDSLQVTIYNVKNTKAIATATIPVKSLSIKSIKIDGIDGEEQDMYESKNYTVVYKISGVDTADNAVDFKKLDDYANGAQIKSGFKFDNANVVASAEINKDGKLEVTTKRAAGKAIISAVASDGIVTTATIEVKADPFAATIVFPEKGEIQAIAGEASIELPIAEVYDQYKNKMDLTKIDLDNTFAFGIVTNTGLVFANASDCYNSTKKALMLKGTSAKAGSVTITATHKTLPATSFSVTFDVTAGRAPSVISIKKAPNTSLVAGNPGQSTDIEFEIKDAYGKKYEGSLSSNYYVQVTTLASYTPAGGSAVAANTFLQYTNGVVAPLSDGITKASVNAGEGKITITAKNTQTSKPEKISLQLYKVVDGVSTKLGDAIEYNFTVNPDATDITVKPVATTYTAGETITIKYTALDGNGKILTTYNDETKNVTIKECTKAVSGGVITATGKTFTRDLVFTNGEATVEVPSWTASVKDTNKIVYKIDLYKTPGNKSFTSDTALVSDAITVNTGAATTFKASGNKLEIKDAKDNLVDFTGDILVKVVVTKGTLSSPSLDSEGYVKLAFKNGKSNQDISFTLTADSSGSKEYTITSKDNTITGKFTSDLELTK